MGRREVFRVVCCFVGVFSHDTGYNRETSCPASEFVCVCSTPSQPFNFNVTHMHAQVRLLMMCVANCVCLCVCVL